MLKTSRVRYRCPFCGSTASVVQLGEKQYAICYRVRCDGDKCGAAGGTAPTASGALELWSRRVEGETEALER